MKLNKMFRTWNRTKPQLLSAIQTTRNFSGHVQPAPQVTKISIPLKIKRGPTDILQALASTVGRDYTAPHYKYHDDPFLIPASNIGKRTFALAKESGKKAAQWIMTENLELFNSQNAEPAVPAYVPRVVYTDASQVNENDLQLAIEEARVEEAIRIFENLQKSGKDISLSSKQALLQLLCYFNSEDVLPEELIEERWFTNFQKRESPYKNSWNDPGMLWNLFKSIQDEVNEGPELLKAKCTLLRGMVKFRNAGKSWDLYQSMKCASEAIDVDTYNQVIKIGSSLKDTFHLKLQVIEEILKEMEFNNVRPNLRTLNTILSSITSSSSFNETKSYALRVIAEFQRLSIKPSLATFFLLLNIFNRDRGSNTGILYEILEELEKEGSLKMQDPLDTQFFVAAMNICKGDLGDISLAKRIHSVLNAHNNYDFIGDTYKESIYYRLFFTLIVKMEPLENFMEFYHKYVPNIYIPEPTVMEHIIRSINMHGAWEMLPSIWSDIVLFDMLNRENMIALWFETAVKSNFVAPFESLASIEQSKTQFYATVGVEDPSTAFANLLYEAALSYWDKIVNQPKRFTSPIVWTGSNLGHCLVLAVRANKFTFALKILDRLKHDFAGAPPSIDAMRVFLERAIKENDSNAAVAAVCFTAEAGYAEAAVLADELKTSSELTELQLSKLNSALGLL